MDTRQQIIDAADHLFYRNGFTHTSFTDIASTIDISRGNFYHHFKSKNEILSAVIQARLDRTKQFIEQWEKENLSPKKRIASFINILTTNKTKIAQYGCPVGTLTIELGKINHDAQPHAKEIFSLFRSWLTEQFIQLGHHKDADALAMHLLSHSQGIATMFNAFKDESFLNREVGELHHWLNTLVD